MRFAARKIIEQGLFRVTFAFAALSTQLRVRVVARGLPLPFYARAFLPLRAPRVQLVARSEGASSLSVDALSHVARFPSVRDVRGQLETDEVNEKVAVLGARDAPRAACTDRLAPCGEAGAAGSACSTAETRANAGARETV